MGACIGKKSSKYLKHKLSESDINEAPQPKVQDEILAKESSSSPVQNVPVTADSTNDHEDDYRISKVDENGLDIELQMILEDQRMINQTLSQPFPSRVISCTDTELELELANLLFEQPDKDFVENTLATTNDNCKETR